MTNPESSLFSSAYSEAVGGSGQAPVNQTAKPKAKVKAKAKGKGKAKPKAKAKAKAKQTKDEQEEGEEENDEDEEDDVWDPLGDDDDDDEEDNGDKWCGCLGHRRDDVAASAIPRLHRPCGCLGHRRRCGCDIGTSDL